MAMASNSEKEEKYTFFDGQDSPFSQFWAAKFVVKGVQYTCAEMYMLHQKAVLFGDHEIAEKILVATTPIALIDLGSQVRNFNEEEWEKHRRQIVEKGNLAKFEQNTDILTKLFETRGTTLVQVSPRDRIWGVDMGEDNPNANNKNNWRGQNLLGYILTEVREKLSHAG